MPNRLLKESVCCSENIDALTWFQEAFFYRLIVNCDDYGRMDARPKVLASKLFPLKDVRISQVNDALRALSSAELVILYQNDEGHPFLQMKTWDRHQQIRAKKSKYPAPDGNCKQMISDDINCNQMISNDSKCPRNPIQSNPYPIQSESVSNAPVREEKDTDHELRFDRFWDAYPRKESKPAARKAFDKVRPDGKLLSKMIDSIERWKRSQQWQENGGQFIPYPASWLNQRKWEDDPPVAHVKKMPANDFPQRDYSDVQDDEMSRLAAEMEQARRDGIV